MAVITVVLPRSPTCSRYPCRDTWVRVPETWGHRRHSCSELSAADQPEVLTPVTVLQSPCRISNIPTNLLLHVLRVPHTEICTCSIRAKRNHRRVSLWKTWISRALALARNAVLTSAVCEAVDSTVAREIHGNVALIYEGEWGRGTTCGGQCWCFHSAHPSPCELNSAAPLKSLKCSVWTHHHAVWACEGKKADQQ